MQNPIEVVLKERNMSSGELAILSGTDGGWIRQLRRGYPSTLGKKVTNAIASLGYDQEWLDGQYTKWREELAEKLRTKYQ